MTDEELLPCPFCGVRAYLIERETYATVECGGCGVEMDGLDGADAVKAWSTRATLTNAAPAGSVE